MGSEVWRRQRHGESPTVQDDANVVSGDAFGIDPRNALDSYGCGER